MKTCTECKKSRSKFYANYPTICAFCVSTKKGEYYHEKRKRILALREKKA